MFDNDKGYSISYLLLVSFLLITPIFLVIGIGFSIQYAIRIVKFTDYQKEKFDELPRYENAQSFFDAILEYENKVAK